MITDFAASIPLNDLSDAELEGILCAAADELGLGGSVPRFATIVVALRTNDNNASPHCDHEVHLVHRGKFVGARARAVAAPTWRRSNRSW